MQQLLTKQPRVTFADKVQQFVFYTQNEPITVTYDSGADEHYISKTDRRRAHLPILRRSNRTVGVANGTACRGTNVTQLPVPVLKPTATEADTFTKFPNSLMRVGKTLDAGTISIFTKEGVTIHNEHDVLITCKGKPILIGERDENGQYQIPLIQQ